MLRILSLLIAATAAVLCAGSGVAHAQDPAPLLTPNMQIFGGGEVYAIARLPDGGLIVGGEFSTVFDPVRQLSFERPYLAKFHPDGSLDVQWAPAPSASVSDIVVDAAGSVYIAGSFAQVSNISVPGLAKLSGASGAMDPAWTLRADSLSGSVAALALGPGGEIYVGGSFESLGGTPRLNLAKLSATTGAVDPAWNPSSDDSVASIVLDGNGAMYVGGSFTEIGGESRARVAKLALSSGLADSTWNPGANASVKQLALGTDGIYAVGSFSTIGGQTRNHVAKLARTGAGSAVTAWNTLISGGFNRAHSIAVNASGMVYVGGHFSMVDGQAHGRVARLSGSTGAADASWNPSLGDTAEREVFTVVDDGAGGAYVGGTIVEASGTTALGLARLAANGTTLAAPLVQVSGVVNTIAAAADNGAYVGGDFQRVDGTTRRGLFRLTPDRTLDAQWNPAANGIVESIALDSGAAVYAGGTFTVIGGLARTGVAKLSGSGAGAAEPAWDANVSVASVSAVAVAPGGSVVIAGGFTQVGGLARVGLAKLSGTTGALDMAWNPAPDGAVYDVTIGAGGEAYVGGLFQSIGGQSRFGFAKLASGGLADAAWNAGTQRPLALAVDATGAVFAGGVFVFMGGQSRARIAKLSGTGTGAADPLWNPGASDRVAALLSDPVSGTLYAGGDFATIAGQPRSGVARLSGGGVGSADAWNPSVNGQVYTIARAPNGTIYIGGSFGTVGNTPRAAIAALPELSDGLFGTGFESP